MLNSAVILLAMLFDGPQLNSNQAEPSKKTVVTVYIVQTDPAPWGVKLYLNTRGEYLDILGRLFTDNQLKQFVKERPIINVIVESIDEAKVAVLANSLTKLSQFAREGKSKHVAIYVHMFKTIPLENKDP